MRRYLLYAASLATAMAPGHFSLAQADAEGYSLPPGQAGGITADEPLIPPPPPFSGFDLDRPWASPRDRRATEDLGLEERKPADPAGPPGLPAQAPVAAPQSEVAEAERLKQALSPKPAPQAIRKQMLDALFVRLRNAGGEGDAQRIAAAIERVWLQSDSDTANLLMHRATVSMQARQFPLALSLFDKLVAVEPDWAEAWNQRATTRFLAGDTNGAMADINRVLKLEPRHFGALAGMGMILQGEGFDKRALEIFKKALGIYPLEPNIQKLVEKLTLEIEGQDL
jgi:tetratricopeptide (TPR) repeat protein